VSEESSVRFDEAGIREDESVKRWLDSAGSNGDGDGQRLAALAGFCNHVELAPDELVTGMFRDTEVGKKIKLKRRKVVMAEIDRWEADNGGRDAGNVVRSFLIHNGVALTAAPRW
jgi:hypothetical protein